MTSLAVAAPAATASEPTAGAPGVGDRLFPLLGNGGYDARHYDLRLEYTGSAPAHAVDGQVAMRAVATQALSRFNLDFTGESVSAVEVDGEEADWRREGGELVVTPRAPLRLDATFTTRVAFRSGPKPPGPDPSGEFPSDPLPFGWFTTRDGSVTAGQPDHASEIHPVNDHPSDKATYGYELVVPRGTTAVGNGRLISRRARGDRTEWRYALDDPMASQLIQLAVGDLSVVRRGSVADVERRDVVADAVAEMAEPALSRTSAHLRWMSERVGPYPFDTYGVLVADQFFLYALETQTLSMHPALLFDPEIVPREDTETIMVHELAHQWYGDAVSVETWSDLWLSEGFATWFEVSYAADAFDGDLVEFMRGEYEIADQMRTQFGSVALPARAETLFENQVYGGGALVLYALRQEIGADAFRELRRRWPRRYGGRAAGTDEFIALASEVAGRDLEAFLRRWLYDTDTPPMPGHPDWATAPVEAADPATAQAGGMTGGEEGLLLRR